MRRILLTAGSAALIVGVLATAFGTFGAHSVHAGAQAIPCDATATPTDELGFYDSGSDVEFVSFQQLSPTPVPTCTPTRPAFTHTPTPSRTPEDTATPGPTDTPAPTNTPAPQGTPSGSGIEPPNTGTGSDGNGMSLTFISIGAALVALGGAGIAFGLKKR